MSSALVARAFASAAAFQTSAATVTRSGARAKRTCAPLLPVVVPPNGVLERGSSSSASASFFGVAGGILISAGARGSNDAAGAEGRVAGSAAAGSYAPGPGASPELRAAARSRGAFANVNALERRADASNAPDGSGNTFSFSSSEKESSFSARRSEGALLEGDGAGGSGAGGAGHAATETSVLGRVGSAFVLASSVGTRDEGVNGAGTERSAAGFVRAAGFVPLLGFEFGFGFFEPRAFASSRTLGRAHRVTPRAPTLDPRVRSSAALSVSGLSMSGPGSRPENKDFARLAPNPNPRPNPRGFGRTSSRSRSKPSGADPEAPRPSDTARSDASLLRARVSPNGRVHHASSEEEEEEAASASSPSPSSFAAFSGLLVRVLESSPTPPDSSPARRPRPRRSTRALLGLFARCASASASRMSLGFLGNDAAGAFLRVAASALTTSEDASVASHSRASRSAGRPSVARRDASEDDAASSVFERETRFERFRTFRTVSSRRLHLGAPAAASGRVAFGSGGATNGGPSRRVAASRAGHGAPAAARALDRRPRAVPRVVREARGAREGRAGVCRQGGAERRARATRARVVVRPGAGDAHEERSRRRGVRGGVRIERGGVRGGARARPRPGPPRRSSATVPARDRARERGEHERLVRLVRGGVKVQSAVRRCVEIESAVRRVRVLRAEDAAKVTRHARRRERRQNLLGDVRGRWRLHRGRARRGAAREGV